MRGGPELYKRPRSSVWWFRFRIPGRPQFRGSTGTDSQAEAERIAATKYAEALAGGVPQSQPAKAAPQKRGDIATLTDALGTYWRDRGSFAKTADDIERHSQTLIKELGAETALAALTFRKLSDYVARRRVRRTRDGKTLVDRANASINRELSHLRSVLIHARDNGAEIPRLDWKKLFLPEPDRYETILTVDAEEQFFAELRRDFWPMVEFALETGLRLENVISLRWPQIDWTARTITFRTKSKKPGGQLHVVPLTARIAAILNGERGRHPDIVFTFMCIRSRHCPHSGFVQNKGARYPFTQSGWRREWDRARRAIGLPKLRFHDLRHTAATRTLIAFGDLTVVKEMLGHSDIATTMRYVKADTARVREAMEAKEKLFSRPARVVVNNS